MDSKTAPETSQGARDNILVSTQIGISFTGVCSFQHCVHLVVSVEQSIRCSIRSNRCIVGFRLNLTASALGMPPGGHPEPL